MAEYGYVKTWGTVFIPDWYPYYWGSATHRDPETRVPEKFGVKLLDDLFDDFVNRNRKYYGDKWGEYGAPAKTITYDPETKEFVLKGFNLHWDTEKTEKWLCDNGWSSIVHNNFVRNNPDPALFEIEEK